MDETLNEITIVENEAANADDEETVTAEARQEPVQFPEDNEYDIGVSQATNQSVNMIDPSEPEDPSEDIQDAGEPAAPAEKADDSEVQARIPEGAAEEQPAVPARRRRPTRTIKSLTGHLEAETDEKKANAAWLEIMASLRNRRILKGKVFGIEVWQKMPCASVMFSGVKVLIPAKEFFLSLPEGDDLDESSPTYLRKTKSYMVNRLGSEIEFIVVGFVDKSTQIVGASRKSAMRIRQREYFLRRSRTTGEYLLNEGQRIEVRVASALRFGLVVEVGGMDIFVPNDEVSWNRKADLSDDFYTGQKVIALITKLDRSGGDIKVEVSIKQATPHPFDKAIKMLTTDSNAKYVGVVTLVDKRGIYVQLEDNIEVVCNFPRDRNIVSVGTRVAVKILDLNEKWKHIRGEIVWSGGLNAFI